MSSKKRSISPNTLESEVPPLNRIFGETVGSSNSLASDLRSSRLHHHIQCGI
jgi:hypothetical protein